MRKTLLFVLTVLLGITGNVNAWYPPIPRVLAPTFQSYAVPVSYSYQSAVPVGQATDIVAVTDPNLAAQVGVPLTMSTTYLVQTPVTVTTGYLAQGVSYSSPLYLNSGTTGTTYSGTYSNFYFDRAILGVQFQGRSIGAIGWDAGIGHANAVAVAGHNGVAAANAGVGGANVAVAENRRNTAIAANAGGVGGANVNVVEQRSGLLGLKKTEVIQANAGGAGGANVNVVEKRSGLFGLQRTEVIQANAGRGGGNVAVAKAGRK